MRKIFLTITLTSLVLLSYTQEVSKDTTIKTTGAPIRAVTIKNDSSKVVVKKITPIIEVKQAMKKSDEVEIEKQD